MKIGWGKRRKQSRIEPRPELSGKKLKSPSKRQKIKIKGFK